MKKKKLEKKKKRDVEVQKKLLARRTKERAQAKLERAVDRENYQRREREIPYVNPDNFSKVERQAQEREVARIERVIDNDIEEAKMQIIRAKNQKMSPVVVNRLEDNYKILLSLKAEFLEENAVRDKINAELEQQGFDTLDDKMKHLSEQAINAQKAEAGVLEADEITTSD